MLSNIELFFFGGISNVAVPLFFIISGYLFYRDADFNNISRKIQRRLKSILIPYIVWNTIGYVYFGILMNIPMVAERMNSSALVLSWKSFLLNYWNPILPLWFLKDLFIMVLFAPIILWILNKRAAISIAYLGLTVLMVMLPEKRHSLVYSLFFYMTGAVIVRYFNEVPNKRWHGTVSIVCFVGTAMAVFLISSKVRVPVLVRNVLLLALCMSIWHIVDLFIDKIQYKEWMGMGFLIYCSHWFVVLVIKKIFSLCFGDTMIGDFFAWIMTVIIALVIVYGIGFLLKKRMPKLYTVLSGGR